MARVPLNGPQVNAGKLMLNAESVGLSAEQFYRLCRDNPELPGFTLELIEIRK